MLGDLRKFTTHDRSTTYEIQYRTVPQSTATFGIYLTRAPARARAERDWRAMPSTAVLCGTNRYFRARILSRYVREQSPT
jgi:hypothetical protein